MAGQCDKIFGQIQFPAVSCVLLAGRLGNRLRRSKLITVIKRYIALHPLGCAEIGGFLIGRHGRRTDRIECWR